MKFFTLKWHKKFWFSLFSPLINSFSRKFAQALFSHKKSLFNDTAKAVVRVGITRMHEKHGFMKDDLIESDISFTAEELNNYQYSKDDKKKS